MTSIVATPFITSFLLDLFQLSKQAALKLAARIRNLSLYIISNIIFVISYH